MGPSARWKEPWTSLPIILAVVMGAQHIVPTSSATVTAVAPGDHEALCPPCDLHFSELDISPSSNETYSQSVILMQRGEGKSGTGVTFEWGAGALSHTCKYLRGFFGEKSCTMKFDMIGLRKTGRKTLRSCSFEFEPRKGVEDARCSCAEIDRVSIKASSKTKHSFPLKGACPWAYEEGAYIERESACTFPDGSNPENFETLQNCVEENKCEFSVGDERQMVVLRDPRAVVVSLYYWKGVFTDVDEHGEPLETVDDYVIRVLPILCQWISVRYILFLDYFVDQSAFFWYEDMIASPVKYHRKWLALAGLHLPERELELMAERAIHRELDFDMKGYDSHPGSVPRENRTSYRDELRSETLVKMDPILGQWLPQVFLTRLNIL